MGKLSKYELKRQINECYRARGRQRPSPADEDRDLRRAWEREMAKREREAELEAVEAAAEQAEDDEFWRDQTD